jgi:hypothetical protein
MLGTQGDEGTDLSRRFANVNDPLSSVPFGAPRTASDIGMAMANAVNETANNTLRANPDVLAAAQEGVNGVINNRINTNYGLYGPTVEDQISAPTQWSWTDARNPSYLGSTDVYGLGQGLMAAYNAGTGFGPLSAPEVADLHNAIIQSNAGIAPQAAQESLSAWNQADVDAKPTAGNLWARDPNNVIGNVGGYYGVQFGSTPQQDWQMDHTPDLASYGTGVVGSGDLQDQRWGGAGWGDLPGLSQAPVVGAQLPAGLLGGTRRTSAARR